MSETAHGHESSGWVSLYKLVTFFLIGQWTPDSEGRGIARDIKKTIYFHFKNSTKNGDKDGTIYKARTLLNSFLNCPNVVSFFFRVLNLKIYFFWISPTIHRPLPSRINWHSILPKKNKFLGIFRLFCREGSQKNVSLFCFKYREI